MSLDTIAKLKDLPLLKTATFHGNPIEYKIPQYRARVIRMLPQLISLDCSGITPSERDRRRPPKLPKSVQDQNDWGAFVNL